MVKYSEANQQVIVRPKKEYGVIMSNKGLRVKWDDVNIIYAMIKIRRFGIASEFSDFSRIILTGMTENHKRIEFFKFMKRTMDLVEPNYLKLVNFMDGEKIAVQQKAQTNGKPYDLSNPSDLAGLEGVASDNLCTQYLLEAKSTRDKIKTDSSNEELVIFFLFS